MNCIGFLGLICFMMVFSISVWVKDILKDIMVCVDVVIK